MANYGAHLSPQDRDARLEQTVNGAMVGCGCVFVSISLCGELRVVVCEHCCAYRRVLLCRVPRLILFTVLRCRSVVCVYMCFACVRVFVCGCVCLCVRDCVGVGVLA